MSRKKKSLNNFIYALVGQFLGIIVSFISRIIFIKYLGNEYLGLNGLFSNILTIISLAEMGIGEAINFSLYEPLSTNNKEKCNMLMQFYKKIYTIIGILILIFGIFVTPFLNIFINDNINVNCNIYIIFLLFVFNSSVSYFSSYKRNLIIADQNRYIATIYRYSTYIVMNIIQILCLMKFKNYIGYLVIQIIFTIIENILISLKANKLYPYLKRTKKIMLDNQTKKEIRKNTKAMLMHKIGGIIVSSTDNIILSKYVNLISVGMYSNYCLIFSGLNSVISQFYNSIIASVGNLFATTNSKKQYEVFEIIDFVGFTIYSFCFICLGCLLNLFIKLWIGENYILSQFTVFVLIINFYLTGMRKSVMTFREASGLFYKDRWKAIIESIVNIIFSIVLVKKIGMPGVFLGTLISSITVCVWVEPYILFKYGFKRNVNIYFTKYMKEFIFTVFVFLQIKFLTKFVNCNLFLRLILNLFIVFFVYIINYMIIFRKNKNYIYFKFVIKKFFDDIKEQLKIQ